MQILPPETKRPPSKLLLVPGALLDDFWGTLAYLTVHRPLWLLGGLSALALELFSYFYYQRFLHLRPCEYCVLIRFCMLIIFFGGLTGAIYPKNFFPRCCGFIISLWGAILGLYYTLKLEDINLDALNPDFLPVCGTGEVIFPFGIPMTRLFPSHFTATGTCGEDTLWSLLGFNMAEYLMMIYIIYILGLSFMFISTLLKTKKESLS
ncbi:MAG: disulfide bond formation protein B [Deltaproteobacteria bacterium]|nr:disulfide bond formation protein B [Deltaproteobacteria bacterium]